MQGLGFSILSYLAFNANWASEPLAWIQRSGLDNLQAARDKRGSGRKIQITQEVGKILELRLCF